MEIFDDETYEIMEREYQKVLSSSPLGGLKRAVKGEMPFRLKENDRISTLIECAKLNKRLQTLCSSFTGYRGEVLKQLIDKNAEELPKAVEEDSVIEIKRYENPFIKICYALICSLEEAQKEQKGLNLLVCRTYAIMSAFFGM